MCPRPVTGFAAMHYALPFESMATPQTLPFATAMEVDQQRCRDNRGAECTPPSVLRITLI